MLPEVVIDVKVVTTLVAEHLLNWDGALEIVKQYHLHGRKIAAKVSAMAQHATAEGGHDLLRLNNPHLMQWVTDAPRRTDSVHALQCIRLSACVLDGAPSVRPRRADGGCQPGAMAARLFSRSSSRQIGPVATGGAGSSARATSVGVRTFPATGCYRTRHSSLAIPSELMRAAGGGGSTSAMPL